MHQLEKQNFFILVVDDNKNNLELVFNYLKVEGYKVALSLNAEDALNILSDNSIDLILLDIMMPGTDGLTLCKKLKSIPELADIPVIFLTAKTETNDLVEAFKVGGVDYITKPFRSAELVARIENHVKLADARKRIIEQSEEINKITRTKDRLYSVIAHDIKSPFVNISMLISTMADGLLDPCSEEYKEILKDINISSQETLALLEKLLQWTKSQTGDLVEFPEPLNIKQIIANACRFSLPQADKKKIKISQESPDDLIIQADRNMIQSVFHNLINNAIKFTHEGGKVDVIAGKDKNRVMVKIEDNGIGISSENLKKLFDDREQVTTRGTNNEKGSGLGLMLVNDFVKRNNGTIDVESKPSEGTTFILTFCV